MKTFYTPGERAFPFSIELLDGSTFSFGYDTRSSLPLVIWVTDFENNPWSKASLMWDYSLDMFFETQFALDNCTYVFVAKHRIEDIMAFKYKLLTRAATLAIEPQIQNRFLFANFTLKSPSFISGAPKIVEILEQWTSSVSRLRVNYPSLDIFNTTQMLNISRLDCYWPNCGTTALPSNTPLVLGGDGCELNKTSTATVGKAVVVTANSCSYEQAALNVFHRGGVAALVVMRESEETSVQINTAGEEYIPLFTTSIAFTDYLLLRGILLARNGTVSVQLYSQVVTGSFLVVDCEGQLQEMGSTVHADFRLASWAAQYEVYLQRLSKRLFEGSFVVPLFQNRIMSSESEVVSLPPQLLKTYRSMSIETRISCAGATDSDCSGWDHCVTLSFRCAAAGKRNRGASQAMERTFQALPHKTVYLSYFPFHVLIRPDL